MKLSQIGRSGVQVLAGSSSVGFSFGRNLRFSHTNSLLKGNSFLWVTCDILTYFEIWVAGLTGVHFHINLVIYPNYIEIHNINAENVEQM